MATLEVFENSQRRLRLVLGVSDWLKMNQMSVNPKNEFMFVDVTHFWIAGRLEEQVEDLRRFALAVQLHGAGAFLGEERHHLLRLAVLHRRQEALVVLVPLIGL